VVIAVDFDGTIVENCWPDIGPFRFMAGPVLKWLQRRGHTLILWTCRDGETLGRAKRFLWSHGICFDYYNLNAPARVTEYGGDCRKISADLYIDDRAGWVFWPFVFLKILWMETREWLRSRA
jgi:hypothetical protein